MCTKSEFETTTAEGLAGVLGVRPEAVSFRYSGPVDGHEDITAVVQLEDGVRRIPLICGISEE